MDVNNEEFEVGKLGVALCLLGFLGWLIAGYFSLSASQSRHEVAPYTLNLAQRTELSTSPDKSNQIGPIVIERAGVTYDVITFARLPANHWTFVEIVVVNKAGDYLYSFGQELWHETGNDSEGFWREARTKFESSLTFPETGEFYLDFVVSSYRNQDPKTLQVRLVRRNGSPIIHFWLGMLLMTIGLICVEIQYGVFEKLLEASTSD